MAKTAPLRSRLCKSLNLRSRDREGAVLSDFYHGLLVLLGHKNSAGLGDGKPGVSWRKMTPRRTEGSAVSEIYELLRHAARRKRPVAAIYDGESRLLCPHVGGRKAGRWNVFCYQFGGSSCSAEAPPPGGGVWRCLAVEKLGQVELREGEWHTEPRSGRQTCIDEIDFDIDAQPGADPQ